MPSKKLIMVLNDDDTVTMLSGWITNGAWPAVDANIVPFGVNSQPDFDGHAGKPLQQTVPVTHVVHDGEACRRPA
jgi:hypothetical protein